VKSVLYISALVLVALPVVGQGTLLVDQQSANRADAHTDTQLAGVGQGFTPTFSSIGFIQLAVADVTLPPGPRAQVVVNLRSSSITGAIIGTTVPVDVPYAAELSPGFFSTYFFSTPVALTPGTPYFFQPVDPVGHETINIGVGSFNYAGGPMYVDGNSLLPNSDLWFTEGIVVPEPGAIALLALGSGMVAWHLRRRRRTIPGRA
jgi:hypothetical protein